MRILLGGGGTGGHLIPGIALYTELTANGHSVLYVLREGDLSFNAASQIAPQDRLTVELGHVSRRVSFKSIGQVWSIFKAWRSAFRSIKAFRPDAVLVTGGYVSNIAALSAFFLRVPLFLLEQNSVAGITNRFWARSAAAVFTFFPEVRKVPAHKIVPAGNPLLYKEKAAQSRARVFFGFSEKQKTLGVSGGSQGAKVLNDLLFSLLPRLQDLNIIWSLGTREYRRFADEGHLEALKAFPNVRAERFIDRMDYFWCAADGVLARAGAGTVSESLFFGTPTLFIPIHQSPDNHQYLNAAHLCCQNMGLLLEEPDLSEDSLFEAIQELFAKNTELRAAFPQNGEDPALIIRRYLERHVPLRP